MVNGVEGSSRHEVLQELPSLLAWTPKMSTVQKVSFAYAAWLLIRLQVARESRDVVKWLNSYQGDARERVWTSPLLYNAVLRGQEITKDLRSEIDSLVSVNVDDDKATHSLMCSGKLLKCINGGLAFLGVREGGGLDASSIMPSSKDDLCMVERKLAKSIKLIETFNPAAAQLIGGSARLIAVGAIEDPHRFISSSDRMYLGSMCLINAHSELCSIERLADSLVHESIHSFLYKMELRSPLFCDLEKASSVTAQSPWTGRILPLTSIVHAYFVWYGLVKFWRNFNYLDCGNSASRKLEEEATLGFTASLERNCFSPEYGIAPGVGQVIEAMHNIINADLVHDRA